MAKSQRRVAGVNQRASALLRNQEAINEHSYDGGKGAQKKIEFKPQTDSQWRFVHGMKHNEVSVGIGPAGVGKTFCAATVAAQMLNAGEVDRIILTRANVTVGRSIGLLPGTIEEKMAPLLQPILSVLKRQMGEGLYNYCLSKKKIEMLPFEYVRGMSFKDAFIIVDEAQNLTPDEVKALCTRYESGRIVLLGDPYQHDLKSVEPGITWLEGFAGRHNLGMPVTRFGLEDIVRSGFVKTFLTALHSEL